MNLFLIFLILIIAIILLYLFFEKKCKASKTENICHNKPITRGNSVWVNGGYIAKNQRIIFLDNTYFDPKTQTCFDKRASIGRILQNYKDAGVKDVRISEEKRCDCDELLLLEGEGLENIQINTHPDGSDAGNCDSGNPAHGCTFTFGLDLLNDINKCIPKNDDTITIGILDTGLSQEMINSGRFLPGRNFTNSTLPDDITDNSTNGHGTSVAKIISEMDSEIANILPIKIFDESGNLFDAMCGMLYAKKEGVQLINCSWGYQGLVNPVFEKVVKSLTDDGILIVCSTGNKNKLLSPAAIFSSPDEADKANTVSIYPALFSKCNPNVIAVTNDGKGNFSDEYAKILVKNKKGSENYSELSSFSAALITKLITENYDFKTRLWNKVIAERSTDPKHIGMVENQTIAATSLY